MLSQISQRLLIYHSNPKSYEGIISKRLPQLKIRSASHPQEALNFVEEAEIILSWKIPDDLLKRAKNLALVRLIGSRE